MEYPSLDPRSEELLCGLYSTKGKFVGADILKLLLTDVEAVIFTGPPGVGKTGERKQLVHALKRTAIERRLPLEISEIIFDDLREEVGLMNPPVLRNSPGFHSLYVDRFNNPLNRQVLYSGEGQPIRRIKIAEIPAVKSTSGLDRGEAVIQQIVEQYGKAVLIVDNIPDLFAQERAIFTREILGYPLSILSDSLLGDARIILAAEDTTDTEELGKRAKRERQWMASPERLIEIRGDMSVRASDWADQYPALARAGVGLTQMPPEYDPEKTYEMLNREASSPLVSSLNTNVLASRLVTIHNGWKDNFKWKPEDLKLLAAHRHHVFVEELGVPEDRYFGIISLYNHGFLHMYVNLV